MIESYVNGFQVQLPLMILKQICSRACVTLKLNVFMENILSQQKHLQLLKNMRLLGGNAKGLFKYISQNKQIWIRSCLLSHCVLESSLLSGFINPAIVWCFIGEDFMKRIQQLGESCVEGLNAAQAFLKMMSHYRVGMQLQFSKH